MPTIEEEILLTASQRDGAILFGEKNANICIRLALQLRDQRRMMWRAVSQLKVGKTAEARQTLEKALAR